MMQRMSRWTLLLVLAGTGGAATLTAQSAATAPKLSAKTPAECTKGASDWRNTQLQPLVAALRAAPAEQRNDALATYNATYPLVLKESVRAAKECATAFSWETIATSQLADLVTLYAFTNDSVSRKRATARAVAARDLPPRGHANALLLALREEISDAGSHFGIIDGAERAMVAIDALPDSLDDIKISAHQTMMGRYEYLDVAEGLRDHAARILTLSRRAGATAAARTPAAVKAREMVMASAYHSLARAAADMLHPDSALAILDRGEAELGATAKESFADFRARYALIGTRAATIQGEWWINSADSSAVRMDDGKVHLVEFTAHWCVPCKNSYPGVKGLGERFANAPFEGTMVTSLYGYLGDRKNLTPEQEIAADRDYFGREHALPFRIAINTPPKQQPGTPFRQPKPDTDYRVGGIPQIIIIDRHGIIRQIITGWDHGNSTRLATLIDALVADAPH